MLARERQVVHGRDDGEVALATYEAFQGALEKAGMGGITTEMRAVDGPLDDFFFYAEDYHQQYLDKNPDGYCGLGGTGVSCPIGTGVRG